MGRLIPAGTGMEFYRNVKVDRDESMDQAGRERDLEDFPEITGGLDVPGTTTSRTAAVTAGGEAEAGNEE